MLGQDEGCVLLKEQVSDTAVVFYCNIWIEREGRLPEVQSSQRPDSAGYDPFSSHRGHRAGHEEDGGY